jgi:hypothetical protein
MLVICNGMPRSASTWSFNVAVELLATEGAAISLHTGYSNEPDAFLAAIPPEATNVVLKCHAFTPTIADLSKTGAARVIYTIRNIADATVSFIALFRVDFDHAIAVMDAALHTLRLHRANGKALILGYDAIVANPADAVSQVAGYLGLTVAPERLREVIDETSLPRMRDKVPRRDDPHRPGPLVSHEGTFYDPKTLLNVGHIQDARPGAGRRTLNRSQMAQVDALLHRYGLNEALQPVT